jgi:hypothetical protein
MHGRNRKRAQENGEQVRGKEHWMMGMSEWPVTKCEKDQ